MLTRCGPQFNLKALIVFVAITGAAIGSVAHEIRLWFLADQRITELGGERRLRIGRWTSMIDLSNTQIRDEDIAGVGVGLFSPDTVALSNTPVTDRAMHRLRGLGH